MLACGGAAGTSASDAGGSRGSGDDTASASAEGATSVASSTSASASASASTSSGPTTGEPDDGTTPIPAEPQRDGDAQAGYHALLNNNYVSCGIPWTAYSQVFGAAPEALQLPGRDGKNATLPYDKTAIVTNSGVEVVTANCLQCHAGHINGQLVVGLGNSTADYTAAVGGTAALAGALLTDPDEKAELARFVARLAALEPYTQTRTIGVNPADNVAAVLFSHRDPKTFAWNDPPLLELPSPIVIPVDVPPWWWMKKKHAMFYVAAGRGDHARTMMAASTLCTDTVEEARAIDEYFPDIHAYVLGIAAPKYPFVIDAALAKTGEGIFNSTCARCHGTYGAGGSYPNLLVDVGVIGTDPVLAAGGTQFSDRYLQWFAESFYGELARLEPQDGYVAPPLDGVWASAPYFHNGAVPTVADVLASGARPKYWTRSFDSKDYDPAKLGWHYSALDHGQDGEPDAAERKKIYDTTLLGYGNGGHDFGDGLAAEQRLAVIEYLKTL
ncbi:MAG: c-type cytochrome [Nannocystis sp.]|nr:c-type cytochrome [Nannocystis sp.]MBA3550290.1 c-type cytochrome [Nannocystis sp.]